MSEVRRGRRTWKLCSAQCKHLYQAASPQIKKETEAAMFVLQLSATVEKLLGLTFKVDEIREKYVQIISVIDRKGTGLLDAPHFDSGESAVLPLKLSNVQNILHEHQFN